MKWRRIPAHVLPWGGLWLCVLAFAPAAWAACTVPAANAGDVIFNTTYKVMQYCNGTDWINAGAVMPSAPQTGCTNPAAVGGSVLYNGPLGVIQFCNGSNWINTACAATRKPNGPGCGSDPAGALRYVGGTVNEMQFCDSTDWVAMGWPCATSGLTDWNLVQQIGKFYNTPPVPSGSFGATSMSISGDTLAIGSYSENTTQGAVYVFTRSGNTWTQQARLTSPLVQNNSSFGWNVSIDGDTLAVSQPGWDSAPGSRNDVGKVFVFTRSGGVWSHQGNFSGSDVTYSYFGNRMVLSGDTVLSYWQSNYGTGTVYVHKRTGSTWALESTLTHATPSGNDFFGNPFMILKDNMALIGTGANITPFSRSGSTWTRGTAIPKPSESDAGLDGGFVLSGDTFLLAGRRDSAPTYQDGSVYVYKNVAGTWTKSARLTMPSRTGTTALFGSRLALSPDAKTAFIGGNFQAIEVFRDTGGTWSHLSTISATDTVADDYFGAQFVLDGNRALLVSANGDDDNGTSASGSVYVFSR